MQVIRHYMDWLLDMPWTLSKEEQQATIDVHAVEDSLERDHYGLAKVRTHLITLPCSSIVVLQMRTRLTCLCCLTT